MKYIFLIFIFYYYIKFDKSGQLNIFILFFKGFVFQFKIGHIFNRLNQLKNIGLLPGSWGYISIS